jgi:type III restriction enzyme
MNSEATYTKNRLSLRPPQAESLSILCSLADELTMRKGPSEERERTTWLAEELKKVQSRFPTCKDFERSFPSICFALATGVGKTRLMGAFIAYLHKAKNINNFFVLAPNLTIYNKLITDFGDPSHPKYVFQGIGEFVHQRPRIITGENYREISQSELFGSDVHINIFNISKINAETRGGAKPKIRGMIEYLGQPYFEYLLGLDDLVLLMDESHHYRADRGMQVINELNPVLGLELTATPKLTDGTLFKNVVYEYSLAKAIQDGFVKQPAVATRKDFDPAKFSKNPIELDRLKLEDGLRLHEDTKVSLEIYAKDNKSKPVKPFVLVVTRDTTHAAQIKELIQSPGFFRGYYADKIIEVHSNQRGEEKDENIGQLLALEDPANEKEIVIHVNMLKEGWDVTNLYTIVPLRAANAEILIEQTIGRGLRLPYGRRTGNTKVDRLTIMAHDRFQAIVDEANKPDSLIRAENIIMIEDQDTQEKEAIEVKSTIEQQIVEKTKVIETTITDPEKKKKALHKLDAESAIISVLPELNTVATSSADLLTPEVKEKALVKIEEFIYGEPQIGLFATAVVKEARAI